MSVDGHGQLPAPQSVGPWVVTGCLLTLFEVFGEGFDAVPTERALGSHVGSQGTLLTMRFETPDQIIGSGNQGPKSPQSAPGPSPDRDASTGA
ncbi:hypothetical protein GCM10027355_25150 [Haloplanus salinarum]